MIIETNSEKETYAFGLATWYAKHMALDRYIRWSVILALARLFLQKVWQRGLDILEPVSSPTFTIVQVYEEGQFAVLSF